MRHISDFFVDPVLRGSMLGCIFMGLSTSLVGVLIILQKRSLVGEALSHTAYPGLALAALGSVGFVSKNAAIPSILLLLGATAFCLLGVILLEFMEKKMKVPSDTSLCFILSSFFGLGVLVASYLQKGSSLWVKQIQLFLYGQAATMTDQHVVLYVFLAFIVIGILFAYFPHIQIAIFDRDLAKGLQIPLGRIDALLTLLLILAIVIGMRSAGVVLLAGLLIAPPLAARQYTGKLSSMFILSGFFGVCSAFMGNYFSVMIPELFGKVGARPLSLPTGPMILLTASFICVLSLFFAPEKGIFFRKLRARKFRLQCQMENILKLLRKERKIKAKKLEGNLFTYCSWRVVGLPSVAYEEYLEAVGALAGTIHTSGFSSMMLARRLAQKKWIALKENRFVLTQSGLDKADRIIHLHKLFEVYLVEYLGQKTPTVKRAAQQMEHIMTKEMEQEIMHYLEGKQKS